MIPIDPHKKIRKPNGFFIFSGESKGNIGRKRLKSDSFNKHIRFSHINIDEQNVIIFKFVLFIPHITQQIYPQDVIAIHDWILELLHLSRYTSIYILIQIVISRRTTELRLL